MKKIIIHLNKYFYIKNDKNNFQYVAVLDIHESHSDVVINSIKDLETEFGNGKFALYSCDVTNVHNFTSKPSFIEIYNGIVFFVH